jgi:hypothetical protein
LSALLFTSNEPPLRVSLARVLRPSLREEQQQKKKKKKKKKKIYVEREREGFLFE